jgi:hypothetical protein
MFTIPNSNSWSCLPASFSMVCNVSFQYFIALLGHDGDARPYKDKSKRRGFHLQECIDIAWKLGFTCMPIELFPAMTYAVGAEVFPVRFGSDDNANLARFMHYLTTTKRGILEGLRAVNGIKMGHAVAWDGELIYDPSGRSYSFENSLKNNFNPHTLWILTEVGYDATRFLDI